jgi:hypothetical protein
LIRERFHSVVHFCGPQHAGEVEVEGVRGRVYLGQLSIWLFLAKSTHNGVLSDAELGDLASPHLLVRNLLLAAQESMRGPLCHLDRIEEADGDTVSLLRYYLEDSAATIVDGMALGEILGPRGDETAQLTAHYLLITIDGRTSQPKTTEINESVYLQDSAEPKV